MKYFIYAFERMCLTLRKVLLFPEVIYFGDRTIDEIYQNSADKKLLEQTIEELKYSKIKNREITLSCGNTIIISL